LAIEIYEEQGVPAMRDGRELLGGLAVQEGIDFGPHAEAFGEGEEFGDRGKAKRGRVAGQGFEAVRRSAADIGDRLQRGVDGRAHVLQEHFRSIAFEKQWN
jgi:hypothetical protein